MSEIKMLPLPDIERYEVVGDIAYPINSDPNGDYVEYDGHVSAMADYARAVAEHNVAARDAEIEALRAEVERWEERCEEEIRQGDALREQLRDLRAALRDHDQEGKDG